MSSFDTGPDARVSIGLTVGEPRPPLQPTGNANTLNVEALTLIQAYIFHLSLLCLRSLSRPMELVRTGRNGPTGQP